MDRKKLTKRLIFLIFFILVVNFLANTFYWYSSVWYFDMIMHFLGGFWIGLLAFYLFNFFGDQATFFRPIFKILLFVFFIGAGWEVFELLFYNYIAQNPFNIFDTFSDIFFDLSGGVLSVFYFLKRIMPAKENTV
jgi:hypothetical protein